MVCTWSDNSKSRYALLALKQQKTCTDIKFTQQYVLVNYYAFRKFTVKGANVIFKLKPRTRSDTIESTNMIAYGPRNIHVHDVVYVSFILDCNFYKNQFTDIKKQHVHVQRSIFLAQPYCVTGHIHIHNLDNWCRYLHTLHDIKKTNTHTL